MNFFRTLSVLFLSLVSSYAFAHGDESRVAIELESPAAISAGKTIVSFQLIDTESNKVLTENDLNISHEKKLHFISYDPSLTEFQHLHPEFDGKLWNVELTYAVNGNYFIWVQGELSSDSEEFSSVVRVEVTGGKAAWPAPVLGNVRSGKDAGSVATLSSQTLKAGKMAMLTLTLTREDGTPAQITPYLGAFAHVISTPEDGDSLIHVHPMNTAKPNEGMLHASFPTTGNYRLWIQFQDASQLKTVPLSVEVK